MSTDFSNALAGFRKHAAKTLKKDSSELEIVPNDESGVMPGHRGQIGALVRFEARPKEDDGPWLSAWAGPSQVVTPEQNLGLLFEAAGFWTPAPKLNAEEIAEQIIWGLGGLEGTVRLIVGGTTEEKAPELVLEMGNGQLTFAVGMRERGPGGAGGGPEKVGRCVVKLSSDHSATLEIAWVQ